MTRARRNYVDGEWIESSSGETFEVRNPAEPTTVVDEYQQSNEEDVEAAVTAAAVAADSWAETPAPRRGEILRDAAKALDAESEELIEALVREEGKTRSEAGEVERAIDIFYYFAEQARDFGGSVKQASDRRSDLYTVTEPLGVAALITPWNYPIAIPAWKIAPALATGNSVVVKPGSNAPGPALAIVEALDRAGIPDGVVNVLTGSGRDVGEPLIGHEDVDAVSFTGSTEVGEMVYDTATEGNKRVQCEMGGKNPTIVTESADLDDAVEIVGTGAFGTTGQSCTACSRAIVSRSVYDEFLEKMTTFAQTLEIGNGLDDPDMGPHVSEDELESTLEYVDIAKDEGAELVYGGSELTDGAYETGYYVQPTIFGEVESTMRIAREEVFGPVLSVIPVSGFDEAMTVANDVEYGLSASIVTSDHTEAERFVDDIEAGVAKVNETTTGLELHVPFGGYKRSSTNTYREQGEEGMRFFTSTKTVYDNYY
ncbi:MAG: aldehyde dehydrogenase family protein [Halodesulfurarchaeum sp.]